MAKSPNVVMVGAFPPPVHGMAVVNDAVRQFLHTADATVKVINLTNKNSKRSLRSRLSRLPRVTFGLGCFLLTRQLSGKVLYISVSGGLGKFYELTYVLAARARGMRIYMHHHAYSYLDRPNWLCNLLLRTAGPAATHVALSRKMASRLISTYRIKRVITISNAVFVGSNAYSKTLIKPRRQLRTIGFLSNLTQEKGVFEFLELVAKINSARLPLRALLAGPVYHDATEHRLRTELAALNDISYLGPIYGTEKIEFFDKIDLLIFPTSYINEAEPLVIHEAMSRGLPVIAYGRGAIPEILGPGCGLVIPSRDAFVPPAFHLIKTWLENPSQFRETSLNAVQRFAATSLENKKRWDELLQNIIEPEEQNAM